MELNLTLPENRSLGRQIVTKLKIGIRSNQRFEDLSADILNTISQQLLLVEDGQTRQAAIFSYYKQLQKAEMIQQFHMVYEKPGSNKQLHAALNHLKGQFKLRFGNYI